jgi:hypothetical protein
MLRIYTNKERNLLLVPQELQLKSEEVVKIRLGDNVWPGLLTLNRDKLKLTLVGQQVYKLTWTMRGDYNLNKIYSALCLGLRQASNQLMDN